MGVVACRDGSNDASGVGAVQPGTPAGCESSMLDCERTSTPPGTGSAAEASDSPRGVDGARSIPVVDGLQGCEASMAPGMAGGAAGPFPPWAAGAPPCRDRFCGIAPGLGPGPAVGRLGNAAVDTDGALDPWMEWDRASTAGGAGIAGRGEETTTLGDASPVGTGREWDRPVLA